MPYTPARTARELDKQEIARDIGRQQNEVKYSEFKINCDGGDPGSCNSLGEWWALMRQDFRQALDLYTATCLERRYPQACLNMGSLLLTGRDGPFSVGKDVPRALDAFRIGCSGGLADSCYEASRLVFRDATIKLSAADLKAASAGSSGGAGSAEAVAAGSGSASTPASAAAPVSAGADATTTAAAAGDAAPAPAPAARTPLSGRDLAEDVHEAIAMLHRGCTADTTSANGRCCGVLAGAWFSGKLPVAQVWEALGMPRPAGSPPHPASVLPVSPEQIAAAVKGLPQLGTPVELLETACTREHAESCLTLGSLYRLSEPRLGVVADEKLAEKFDKQGYLWQGQTERVANRSVAKKAAALAEELKKAAAFAEELKKKAAASGLSRPLA